MKRVATILLAASLAFAGEVRADAEVSGHIAQMLRGPAGATHRAIERLAFLGPERAGPALRAMLENPDPRQRILATEALIVVRDPRSAKALERRLEDDDWEVRANAATALGRLKHRTSAGALEKALRGDGHVRVRKASATALGEIGAGYPALVEVARQDGDLEMRLMVLDHLARPPAKKASPKLRPLLEDPSGMVRFATARTLAWHADPAARRFLAARLAEGSAEEQRRAVTVLADAPAPWSADLLASALEGSDGGARHRAAVALAERRDRRGFEYLQRTAAGDDPQAAEEAVLALERLGGAR